MHVSPDNPKGVNRGSTSPMEDAGDWSAKKASVDRPSSDQAKRARGVAAVDLSVLNCTVCSCPLKRPVFQVSFFNIFHSPELLKSEEGSY
jgi:hypothetical protein